MKNNEECEPVDDNDIISFDDESDTLVDLPVMPNFNDFLDSEPTLVSAIKFEEKE